jgi:hypothetical protein
MSHDNHVADHMLRRVGFERPGSQLYALTGPAHDLPRGADSRRSSPYAPRGSASRPTPHTTSSPQPSSTATEVSTTGARTATRRKPSTAKESVFARIVVRDQERDPDGTLRAVSTDMRTREGALLHGEGDMQFVETRLDNTSLAFDAFSCIHGAGVPIRHRRPCHGGLTSQSPTARPSPPSSRHVSARRPSRRKPSP